jgi:hypothetical protein
MSYDYTDAMYDAAMDSLYEDFAEQALGGNEIYDQIVYDFKEGRLCEYYIDNPGITEAAKGAPTEARTLLQRSARCSLVLAATASEVCFRDAILTPILHGSFHDKSSADLIVKLIVANKNDGLSKALLQILTARAGVDLRHFSRSGSRKPLWEEMREIQRMRNMILHKAQGASKVEAQLAIKIADCLISDIFPRVIKKIGLHLHEETVCGSDECTKSSPM